jgi:hypothetical protein
MHQIAMLIAVAGFAAACATSTPEQPPEASSLDERGQPLAALATQSLSNQPEPRDVGSRSDDPPDRSRAPFGTSQPADTIETAGAEAIIQLIEDEGLFVLDIDTAAQPTKGPRTTIRTTVLYGTGRSHPREASYLLELESTGGTWTVVSIEAAS